MNKKTIGAVIVKLGKAFRFISQNRQRITIRFLALSLLIALLTPIFLFDPTHQANAQVKLAIQQPAPLSEPPQAFLMNDGNPFQNSITTGLASFLSFSSETIPNFFSKNTMLEGLELPDNYPLAENSVVENSPSENALANMPLAQPSGSVDFDFDGDGKADLARWHPGTSEWKVKNSYAGTFTTHIIGNNTSIIAPGRFDNDSKTDVAVFNSGTWTIKKSTDGTSYTVSFGTSGDKPVAVFGRLSKRLGNRWRMLCGRLADNL
jgi:hypothetical protein